MVASESIIVPNREISRQPGSGNGLDCRIDCKRNVSIAGIRRDEKAFAE